MTDCDILSEIYTFFGITPYWNSTSSCLVGNGGVIKTDPTKSYITQL